MCCLRKLDGGLSNDVFQILKLIGEFHAIKSDLIVIETKSNDFKQSFLNEPIFLLSFECCDTLDINLFQITKI